MPYQFHADSCSVYSMTACCCNNATKLSVKLPAYAPDKKLAFVERVCAILIESRYGADRQFIPLDQFSKASEIEADDFDATFDCSKPRFARPPAPAKKCSPPATSDSRNGKRGFPAMFVAKFLSPTPLARGSPRCDRIAFSPFTFTL